MKKSIGFQFPEIFELGHIPTERSNSAICADGLCAWACCMAGEPPHVNFGTVMVLIGDRLGISPTADELSKYADTILKS